MYGPLTLNQMHKEPIYLSLSSCDVGCFLRSILFREMLTSVSGHSLRPLSGNFFLKICVINTLKIVIVDFFINTFFF